MGKNDESARVAHAVTLSLPRYLYVAFDRDGDPREVQAQKDDLDADVGGAIIGHVVRYRYAPEAT